MPNCLSLALCVALAVGAASYAAQPSPGDTLVLQRATLIDGVTSEIRRDMTVVIRRGLLESISTGATAARNNATTIDLQNRWLLPGLIDAHVHLRDLASARTALSQGVTTARSLGGDHFPDIEIRERHRAGAPDVPEVLASGYHVRRRLADAFFLDFPRHRALGSGLSGPADVRVALRELVTRGVDVIKVMVTNRAGIPDSDFRLRALTDDETRAAVDEADDARLPVAAHAHTDDGARAAAAAGVRTIEHGTLMGAETLTLLREKGACFTPTLTFWIDMLEPGGEYDNPALAARAREMLPVAKSAVAQASKMGVRVIAGSDMRYDATSTLRVAHEIAELARSGLTPMAALQSATSRSAACLGIGGRTGAVVPGLDADLIVVDRDPLRDLRALDDPVLVVNNGRLAVNKIVR